LVVVELVVLWWSKNMSMALATSSSSQARSPLSSQDVEEEEKEEDKEVAAASSSSLVLDDAIEAESSRSFLMALQELQSLRPQFYSTAEYCESSYLEKDQKDEMFDHLKKFSIEALMNAVDQLGNVVYKLNDLLAQQTTCVTAAELRTAALAQVINNSHMHVHALLHYSKILHTHSNVYQTSSLFFFFFFAFCEFLLKLQQISDHAQIWGQLCFVLCGVGL
jgi:hypothetical protein